MEDLATAINNPANYVFWNPSLDDLKRRINGLSNEEILDLDKYLDDLVVERVSERILKGGSGE